MPNLTHTRTAPLMLGGEPASAALRDITHLAADLVSHFAQSNPTYKSFQMESIQEDLIAVTAQGMRLSIRLIETGQLPSDRELDSIHSLTVKQALAGVPLSAILALTDEGINAFRNLILNRAGSEDSADLKVLNRRIFILAQRLHTFVSVSYLAVIPSVAHSQDAESAHTLASTILAGGDATHLALQMGIDLAPTYLVLRLNVAAPPARTGARDGAHQRLQAHRNLAAAQGRLAQHYGAALLAAPPPHRGLVLIAGSAEWGTVRTLVQQIEKELGIDITAVGEQADIDDVPAAAAHTRELAYLVQRLGLPHASYRMDDLALEYQMTRPGPGRDRLARLLEPLSASPELLQTLSVHLANDQNRQRTASMLGLHTNTVDNRIKRIAQLTGLDPTLPSSLLKIRAAMIALAFTSTDGDVRPANM